MAKVKIDYKSLIDEISEEVKEGVLSEKDTVQVLRAKEPVFEGYRPVEDWYYDDYTMNMELDTPVEEMYMEDEFSKEELEEMKQEQKELKAQYEADKPSLEQIEVKALLTEMKQMEKLFK